MSVIILLAALGLLMFVAYRGYSVILFAPVCALLAVLLSVAHRRSASVHQHLHG